MRPLLSRLTRGEPVMKPMVVLSQMSERLNTRLRERVPDAEIRSWPAGPLTALPPEAQGLIPMPFVRAGDAAPAAPPPGWPFGLRWVQLFSAGLDYYPDWLFTNCVVSPAHGASARSVAEFAIAAIMAAAKGFPERWIDSAEGWRRQGPLGMVAGATLGIMGFGMIGRQVASLAVALGMDVQVVRRSAKPLGRPGVRLCADVAAMFRSSDHVVLALSGDLDNHGLIDAAVLRTARPGLHLVNVARGRLIEEAALLEALDDGRLSRATLDVAYPEPLPPGHRFYRHPRVLLSPHISFDTQATETALIETFVRNLNRFRQGELDDQIVAIGLSMS